MYSKDCEKIKGKIQERVKIVDNEDESESTPLMIYITLQSQEGRKSRVKFLIAKVSHYWLFGFDDQLEILILLKRMSPLKIC